MIEGSILIGGDARHNAQTFRATNPATGEVIGPDFCEASAHDVANACALEAQAAPAFAALSPDARAAFLEACADGILAIGDTLIETAMAESGLPLARLTGEWIRTVNHLRMFASELRKSEFIDATIDPALPANSPSGSSPLRADLRCMNVPVGPVAIPWGRRRRAGDRFDSDVPDGTGGRQAGAGRGRGSARMFAGPAASGTMARCCGRSRSCRARRT